MQYWEFRPCCVLAKRVLYPSIGEDNTENPRKSPSLFLLVGLGTTSIGDPALKFVYKNIADEFCLLFRVFDVSKTNREGSGESR